jgi:hypothetical protein
MMLGLSHLGPAAWPAAFEAIAAPTVPAINCLRVTLLICSSDLTQYLAAGVAILLNGLLKKLAT